MKILIVDDHEPMRKIIKTILKKAGFEDIEEAENGKEALSKLKEKNLT